MSSHDHKVGRPLRASAHSTRNITFRLTEEERAALTWHAEQAEKPVAVLIRDTLAEFGLLDMGRSKR